MKIKTFQQYYEEEDSTFDARINDFIKDKQIIQITTNETVTDGILAHTLTVLYTQEIDK